MAEEITYASVVFKNKTNSRPQKEEEIVYDEVKVVQKKAEQAADAQKEEEIVYDEVKMLQKKAEQPADGLLADQKATNKLRHYQLMVCCLGIVCVILLFSIIAVSVYFTSENNNKLTAENKLENLTKEYNVSEIKIKNLTAENQQLKTNLKDLNNKLSSENERLRRDNDDQTVIIENLTKKYNDSEMKIKNLTGENQQLKTQNQQLETEKDKLNEQIRNIENNITVVQQIIDAYCPIKDGNRQCKPCLEGWMHNQSSCYVINNPDPADQKTWEIALKDCRAKNSDLAVIVNEDEKTFISDNSWNTRGLTGYWIGLRAEAEKWKWIDGSDLTKKSWITDPAASSVCVISVYNQEWKSVNCGNKNGWICKKAALSV
ncbi:C-type lectin domain family 4 member G-like [Scomber japonicus]|uniref:C-type lectin domain family 4 member G-like n=1 Tax=Scomber japonicus TaxID=13676 RepID=UPI0023064328|nr:C-type lectin domain family 4 member G-like [Scomber japonicus]